MTDTTTPEATEPETRAWDIEEPDIAPADYLMGILTGQWEGDEESQMHATSVLLAQVFVKAGLTADEAVDTVPLYLERGVELSLTAEGLHFEFGEADGEADGE